MFDVIPQPAIEPYDRTIGLDFSDVSLGGAPHKSPCGIEGRGPQFCHSVLCDPQDRSAQPLNGRETCGNVTLPAPLHLPLVLEGPDEAPAFADERQLRISELVAARGRVRISELTVLLGVTETTVRKDLTALQRAGVLKRTHGGAIGVRSLVEDELDARAIRQSDAKNVIAKLCLNVISHGDAIFLDSGTTTQLIADQLAATLPIPRVMHLTILTNSIGIALAVADLPTTEHILLGGRVRRVAGSLVGVLAMENLERFSVNVAFIGASGLSENGLTVADADEAQLKAAVIERALRVVVPLDHTKFGATHFAKVCDFGSIDVIITDKATDPIRELCADHNVLLISGEPET